VVCDFKEQGEFMANEDRKKQPHGFFPKIVCKGPGCSEQISLMSKLPHTIHLPADMSTPERYKETFPDQAIVCPSCIWIDDYTSIDIFFGG
jgi:hypothetical protein